MKKLLLLLAVATLLVGCDTVDRREGHRVIIMEDSGRVHKHRPPPPPIDPRDPRDHRDPRDSRIYQDNHVKIGGSMEVQSEVVVK